MTSKQILRCKIPFKASCKNKEKKCTMVEYITAISFLIEQSALQSTKTSTTKRAKGKHVWASEADAQYACVEKVFNCVSK